MRHEFSEVLNDGVDYFLLGDIQLLERFKQDQQLPDDRPTPSPMTTAATKP